MTAQPGTTCPPHFGQAYGHARHYTGTGGSPARRLAGHGASHSARLPEVTSAAGTGWTAVRTWAGTRARERALKRQGDASRRCPECGVRPRAGCGTREGKHGA